MCLADIEKSEAGKKGVQRVFMGTGGLSISLPLLKILIYTKFSTNKKKILLDHKGEIYVPGHLETDLF